MNRPGPAELAQRGEELASVFREIAATRMAGMPLLNPALQVEAIGFAPCSGADEDAVLGILLTPWCMNLIYLAQDESVLAAPGASRLHELGAEHYSFIGAHEPAFGAYEMCSLYSPVFEFSAQEVARAVALEVLRCLRQPQEEIEQPSRRRLLLGGGVATRP